MSTQGIEKIISEVLTGETRLNALDFIDFLKANEFHAGGEYGAITYKNEAVCYMYLDSSEQAPGPWTIWLMSDYSAPHKDIPIDQQLKEIAWANVNNCKSCCSDCSPGKSKTILGKEFNNVCSTDLAFYNPDAKTLEYVKKLIEMRKYEMDKYNTVMEIMAERFGKDSLIAIATTDGKRLNNRMVDAYYENGTFYITTHALSNKVKQVKAHPDVAICAVDWFSGHGTGENLGWVLDPKNVDIRLKLREAFSAWYDQANNEHDKNICILAIHLTDGILIKDHHAMCYQVDFLKKTALLSENWGEFK